MSLKLGAISPAWHRRARRQRADARTLLRLEAARKLLESHHSAQPEMPKAGAAGVKDTWRCPECFYVSTRVQPHQLRYCKEAFQCADWGCVTGSAAKARALEAAKKKALEQQQQKREKALEKAPSPRAASPAPSHNSVSPAHSIPNGQPHPVGEPHAPQEVEDDTPQQIAELRAFIKHNQALKGSLVEAQVTEAKKRLSELQERQEQCKPPKEQLRVLRGRIETLDTRISKARTGLAEAQERLSKLTAERDGLMMRESWIREMDENSTSPASTLPPLETLNNDDFAQVIDKVLKIAEARSACAEGAGPGSLSFNLGMIRRQIETPGKAHYDFQRDPGVRMEAKPEPFGEQVQPASQRIHSPLPSQVRRSCSPTQQFRAASLPVAAENEIPRPPISLITPAAHARAWSFGGSAPGSPRIEMRRCSLPAAGWPS